MAHRQNKESKTHMCKKCGHDEAEHGRRGCDHIIESIPFGDTIYVKKFCNCKKFIPPK